MGGAAFGADAEKATPLKGEVRSGRNQTTVPSAHAQSDDPFSTDSAGSASGDDFSGTEAEKGVPRKSFSPTTTTGARTSPTNSAKPTKIPAKDDSSRVNPSSKSGASTSIPQRNAPAKRVPSGMVLSKPLSPNQSSTEDLPSRPGYTRKFSSQTDSSRTSPSARREAFQKSMQRARAGVQSTRNVNTDPYFQKGVVAEQNGDLAGALENFVVSVNNDPTNKESQNALHKVELKFKRKYPAFHAYSSYFTGKNDARLLLNYGVRLYSISCFRQAENLFNRAATLDPDNPNAYFNLGVIYEHDGQLSKALAQYQKSLALFKLHGADLASSVSTQAQDSRGKTLKGVVVKLNRERRRFSGMEDPTNGPQLAQAAVDSVVLQLKGQPSNIPKWPTLGVAQPPGGRPKAASRHVDTCDHCLILRDVEMWPN